MSIFGKKKEDQLPMPPMPPGPSNGLNEIKEEISAPPQPPLPPQLNEIGMPPAPTPMSSVPDTPMPQVNSSMELPSAPTPMGQEFPVPETQVMPSTPLEMPQNISVGNTSNSDDLFNLDDFELPDLETSLDSQTVEESVNEPISSHSTQKVMSHGEFMPTKGLSTSKEDTYFLTTTEFKHLLEQIDSVKSRIKTTTQRHMRIMSIKAEEDIELESLRKDFQFIEDKLYEVDSTIFDR